MMNFMFLCMIAYLIGAIPTGKIIAKYKGIDIQAVGTKNIGASNTYLVLGKKIAIIVLLGDIGKAYVVMLTAFFILTAPEAAIVSLFLLLGNVKSVFIKFSGGKGVATSLGVFLATEPWIAFVFTGMWIVGLLMSKYVFAVGLLGAITIPITYHQLGHGLVTMMSAMFICFILYVRHKDKWKVKEEPEVQKV